MKSHDRRGVLCRTSLLALALGVLAACSDGARDDRPNVLLISVDTLRADHLGSHGYGRPTSPYVDAFAKNAVVFENAQTSASWTLPGLASIMTARYSSGHGCWDARSSLAAGTPTVARLLRDEGYDTACVVSHIFLTQRYGLQQGFTHFDDELDYPQVHPHEDVTSPRVTERGIDWIEAKAGAPDGRPWFLWLHYFDPHDSYLAHEEESEIFATEAAVDLYDGEIHFTDRHLGKLFEALATAGLDENTIVILTADHGEEFGDHGGQKHGRTLYREQLNVPLMIRAPGFQAARVSDIVRTVDILPTLMELTGVELSDARDGASLVPVMRGELGRPRPALAEIRLRKGAHLDAVLWDDWKLIVDANTDRVELYDTESDPTESDNVAASHPDRVRDLRLMLKALIAFSAQAAPEYEHRVDLSPAQMSIMQQLGYVGADEE